MKTRTIRPDLVKLHDNARVLAFALMGVKADVVDGVTLTPEDLDPVVNLALDVEVLMRDLVAASRGAAS